MTFEELFKKIIFYYHARNLKFPNTKDAAIFLSCEAAEVLDVCMRTENGWIRNTDKPADLAPEIADVLMMVLVLADAAGIDPVEALITKMVSKL